MQVGSRNDDGTSEAVKSMHGRDVRGCCLWEEMGGRRGIRSNDF
jgi:hypothetical protein